MENAGTVLSQIKENIQEHSIKKEKLSTGLKYCKIFFDIISSLLVILRKYKNFHQDYIDEIDMIKESIEHISTYDILVKSDAIKYIKEFVKLIGIYHMNDPIEQSNIAAFNTRAVRLMPHININMQRIWELTDDDTKKTIITHLKTCLSIAKKMTNVLDSSDYQIEPILLEVKKDIQRKFFGKNANKHSEQTFNLVFDSVLNSQAELSKVIENGSLVGMQSLAMNISEQLKDNFENNEINAKEVLKDITRIADQLMESTDLKK
jgi:hypothetical protein